MKALLFMAAVLFLQPLSFPRELAGTAREDLVKKGIGFYRRGNYEKALQSFQAAFDRGYRDGRLEYDMGNCWWRLGDKAKALVHYERAREWMPRDPDVLANIRLCRKALGVDESSTVPFLTSLRSALSAFTLGEVLAVSAAFSVLFFLLLSLYTIFRRPLQAWLALFAGLGLLLFVGLAVGRFLDHRRYALVTVEETELVSEPREGLPPIASLRAGLEVEVLGAGDSWIRVEVGGRKGWLPTKNLGFLDWREPPFRD